MPIKLSILITFLLALHNVTALANSHSNLYFVELEPKRIQQSIERLFSGHGYSVQHSKYRNLNVYFDTPELNLLNNHAYLKFNILEQQTTNKTTLDEKVFYFTEQLGGYPADVKHYNSSKTLLDKHPLFGLIKRIQRPPFLSRLKDDGFPTPFRFKEIAKAAQITTLYTISIDQRKVTNISVNEVEAVIFGHTVTFTTLSTNLTTNLYSSELNKLYSSLFSAIGVTEIETLHNEYSALLNQLNKHVPFFHWLLKYPFIYKILSSFTIGGFGALSIYLILRWRNRKIEA